MARGGRAWRRSRRGPTQSRRPAVAAGLELAGRRIEERLQPGMDRHLDLVNLLGWNAVSRVTAEESRCCGRGLPCLHRLGAEEAEGRSGDQVALGIESVVDGCMGGDELLG